MLVFYLIIIGSTTKHQGCKIVVSLRVIRCISAARAASFDLFVLTRFM